MRLPAARNGGGLCIAAMSYVLVDYLRHLSPTWHSRLQPALWTVLALIAVTRVPFYRHWNAEFRAAIPFVASMVFMLSALLFEALSVRFVTAVLGLDWHRYCIYFCFIPPLLLVLLNLMWVELDLCCFSHLMQVVVVWAENGVNPDGK